MIKILENTKVTPEFKITFKYMIGDGDGDTEEVCYTKQISPIEEKIILAFNKLKPANGHWGIGLTEECIDDNLQNEVITEEEHSLLIKEVNGDGEFSSLVQTECEYFFLVFQGIEVIYIDENNATHEVEFINE